MIHQFEPICAVATAQGVGAIAVIRVSGQGALELVDTLFQGKKLAAQPTHTAHFGTLSFNGQLLDEVLVTVFRSPTSFTREDVAEISCHASPYIIRSILKALISSGCRTARPGEFTQRAFLNGQFDLVQAEAIADLIAADSEAAHRTALHQLRGGFSKKLAVLRDELIHFASMIELELDFGEEDVEFANRDDLRQLIQRLLSQLRPLIESFDAGNAIKEGIPVAIIGPPNAGKSTLLNALLNEEKAIVTAIAGTTRDVIEDTLILNGQKFRLIDTAGIRQTEDVVEAIGIERSKKALAGAEIVLLLFDNQEDRKTLEAEFQADLSDKTAIWVQTKADTPGFAPLPDALPISAKSGEGMPQLIESITSAQPRPSESTLTNLRHYESLVKTQEALEEVLTGLDSGITGDFLAQDIRLALHHLGEITGSITTDDLLDNIFSNFCIGK